MHFVVDPKELETLIPGLNIVSSAFGSVRADTAYCKLKDVFLVNAVACPEFDITTQKYPATLRGIMKDSG